MLLSLEGGCFEGAVYTSAMYLPLDGDKVSKIFGAKVREKDLFFGAQGKIIKLPRGFYWYSVVFATFCGWFSPSLHL
jgi:hypothetical protein